jgi:hypothetical protein
MNHRTMGIGATAIAVGVLIAVLSYGQALAANSGKPKPPPPKSMISRIVADVDADGWVLTAVASLPQKVQNLLPAASSAAKAQPFAGGSLSQPRVYVSTASPVQYLMVWNVSAPSSASAIGILPTSMVAILYDSTLTQQGAETDVLMSPATGSVFKDADGNSFKYWFVQAEGAQAINLEDIPEYLNDVPSATSTDPTCLAYSAFQFAVDLGHASIDMGQLDEPDVDELNVIDSGITFATDDDGQSECPSGE